MTQAQYVAIFHDLGIAAFYTGRTRFAPTGHPSFNVLYDSIPMTDGPMTAHNAARSAWIEGFEEAREKWNQR